MTLKWNQSGLLSGSHRGEPLHTLLSSHVKDMLPIAVTVPFGNLGSQVATWLTSLCVATLFLLAERYRCGFGQPINVFNLDQEISIRVPLGPEAVSFLSPVWALHIPS